jgi:TolB-like protein/class 3 adenylate cyclase
MVRLLQRALKAGTETAAERPSDSHGQAMEHELAAILAADVAGYCRLIGQDEAGTYKRLRAHLDELFEPEIAKHHGVIFSTAGDGLLAEFRSIVDAVDCAVVLQRKMRERNTGVPEHQRIEFRMGVNLGDVIKDGKNCVGDGVNIAARLQQMAEPGGIYVSSTVYDHVRHKMSLAFEHLGEHALKNIADPVSVYRVRLDEAPAAVASVHASALALPDRPSIAVLPFRNLSDDAKWARLADGITEDVTTSLSRSRDLFVIARNSTEVYRDKTIDLRAVGHELGVKYLLEGSVQSFGDRVRVTARLIDAASRSHVWSEHYDRPAEHIFRIQDDVTANIAGRLLGNEGALNEAEREKLRRRPPSNLKAYGYYLLAMQAKRALTKEEMDKARQLFAKAVELDAGLARAYVGLAWMCELEIGLGYTASVAQSLESKLANAQKAVALDRHDGEAHAALATCYADKGDFRLAAEEFGRAEGLAPNNADILLFHGSYLPQLGEPALAAEKVDLAVRLNPNFPPWYNRGLRSAYYFAARFDRALAAAHGAGPSAANDFAWLAVASAQLGRGDEAHRAADKVLELDSDWSAERRMSDFGKFARETEPLLFADGARKAGLPVLATAEQLRRWPDMTRLPACEQERAQS